MSEGSAHDRESLSHSPCPIDPLESPAGAPCTARHSVSVSVRPRTRNCPIRVATSPQSCRAKCSASEIWLKRTPQLACAPTDLRSATGSHGRLSTPRAEARSVSATLGPSLSCSVLAGSASS